MGSGQEILNKEFSLFKANWNINQKECERYCVKVANLIEDDSVADVRLLHVVILLKDEMTSDNETQRKIGITFLSWTLKNLQKSSLNINDCDVIFDFYFNKLQYDIDDFECLKEIVSGLKSIVLMKWYSGKKNTLSNLLTFLKETYNPNQYLASVRYEMFLLLDTIFEKFNGEWHNVANPTEEEKKMVELYIETFLNIANGEKDPRNLLMSFTLNRKITSSLPKEVVYKNSQQLFDILFCYFPITFKPPKNDPYKISNADLKISLRNAISECSFFDNDCFSNLIDKLAASSPSVKNDTLLTINACIEKYDFQSVLKHWLQIWEALKFEILRNNSDEKNEEENFNNYKESVDVVTSLCRSFIGYEDGDSFNVILKKIYQDLENNFINEKNLKQSCDILSSIASINVTSFNKVIELVMPFFFKSTKTLENPSDMNLESMKLMLLNMTFFFDSYLTVFSSDIETVVVENSELLKYKDEILIFLSKALTGTSKNEIAIKTLSVVQFTKLVEMHGYLTESETYMVVQYLTETLLTEEDKNIYYASLEGLKSISQKHRGIVETLTVEKLLDLLKQGPHNDSSLDVQKVLKITIDFTCSKSLYLKEFVIGLVDIIVKHQQDLDFCFLLVGCVYKLVEAYTTSLENDTQNHVMMHLYGLLLSNKSMSEHDGILEIISDTVFQLFINSSTETQQHYFEQYSLAISEQVFSQPCRLVIPFTKMLAALDMNVDVSKIEHHFQRISCLLHQENATKISDYVRVGYYQLCCLLINKNYTMLHESFEELLSKYNDIQLLFWIAKGLVLQNSKDVEEKVTYLIDLLNDDKYGSSVSQCFLILVIDLGIFQKFKNHNNVNVKVLHKQKLFHITVPKLIESFKTAESVEMKSRYLTSLSFILKSTPIQIKTGFALKLLPLLMEAVDVNNSEIKASSLQTIKDTLETQPDVLKEHTETLVLKCLELIDHTNEYNSFQVRLLSLQILQIFTTTIPINYLQPYKKKIITRLVVSLEDPKRLVRKAGVDTRESYYELGQVLI